MESNAKTFKLSIIARCLTDRPVASSQYWEGCSFKEYMDFCSYVSGVDMPVKDMWYTRDTGMLIRHILHCVYPETMDAAEKFYADLYSSNEATALSNLMVKLIGQFGTEIMVPTAAYFDRKMRGK